MNQIHFTVKAGQVYPPRLHQWIDYWKNESISCCRNRSQIQICIISCKRDEQRISHDNSSVFGQIENLWMDKIVFTSKSRKLSWQKFHYYLACEFTAHYVHRSAQKCRDETEMYNYQWIQPLHNNFINAILTCPDCNTFRGGITLILRGS